MREIEAHVREGGSGKSDRLMLAIVANLQREDLSPIEEARAYARLKGMRILKCEDCASSRDVCGDDQWAGCVCWSWMMRSRICMRSGCCR